MRASKYFLPTLREVPAEAETPGHRLLLRGGFIKKLSAGVYSYLPLGLRVLEKVRKIVQEEANSAGAVEVYMPALVPFELLRETGRDTVEVLFKTTDRTERDFALGFTHEEVITDIARSFVHSYRDLPLCLYQIQTKFRDEPRPRAGLLRGKEFIMYDAYSFDVSEEECAIAYDRQREAYKRMFRRMGLETLICDAEAGDIGGTNNEEFMVITPWGEDRVLQDDKTGVAANAERCDIGGTFGEADSSTVPPAKLVDTPNVRTVAEVTAFLGVSADRLVKTLLVKAGERKVAALVRGDRELNPNKLARRLGVEKVQLMSAEEVRCITSADVGFAGPIGLASCEVVADTELRSHADFVVGGNQDDKHYIHVCHGRDFTVDMFADIRVAVDGDPAVSGGTLREVRGIEVGHIFQLGTKYSSAMGATFCDAHGSDRHMVMGCYGLGIGRTMQAIAEVSHDENGLVWPLSVAPFEVVIIIVNTTDSAQNEAGNRIYQELVSSGIEVLLDDRDERAGVKFKDADLLGFPLRVVCGRGIAEGTVELKWRWEEAARQVSFESAGSLIKEAVTHERSKYAYMPQSE